MQKSLREKKKVRRKNLILQEFGRLLKKRGLDGFVMKDISDNLEISLRTLYNYYDNKNDLVADFLSGMLLDFLGKIDEKDLPHSDDFARDVNALLASFFNLPFSEEQMRVIWKSYFVGSVVSQERIELFQKVDRLCIAQIGKIVQNHKKVLKESCELVAEIFYTLFTTSFTKFVVGEISVAQARQELKKKVEIVSKGVLR